MKLSLIWIDLCLKLVFENATTGPNTGCHSVVNCMSCSLQLPHPVHMRAFTGIKKYPNSVTVQNRTCLCEIFWSLRPRKLPPAVMSTSRETLCISVKQNHFIMLLHSLGRHVPCSDPFFKIHILIINSKNALWDLKRLQLLYYDIVSVWDPIMHF